MKFSWFFVYKEIIKGEIESVITPDLADIGFLC